MPIERVPLTEAEEALHLATNSWHFTGKNDKVKPLDYVLPTCLDVDYIRNDLEVFEDDVWIVTPPKCGTTWTQEIVWLMKNEVDTEKAKVNQFYRVPFLELQDIKPKDPENPTYPEGLEKTNENAIKYMNHSIEYAKRLPRPRIIKTHLPLCLLPEKLLSTAKVIFVARNVKDMCVSYYHHYKLTDGAKDFATFASMFKAGNLVQVPALPMMLEAWGMRDNPNLLFQTFEEMKMDFDTMAAKLANFLGVKLSEEQMERLKKAVAFDTIKKNEFVNKKYEFPTDETKGVNFIRKGIVGDWRNHFTEEMIAEWDPWIEEQLKGTGYNMIC